MTSDPGMATQHRQLGPRIGVGVVAVLLHLAIVGYSFKASENEPQSPRVESNSKSWADESRCVECHAQAETFWETGHARTLRPIDDPNSLAQLRRMQEFFKANHPETSLKIDADKVTAACLQLGTRSEVELTWCFGSGQHARTWIGTLTDINGATDLLEFRWSAFQESDDFDVTPGQPLSPDPGYFGGLGVLHDPPKTRTCFACHASAINFEDGSLDESKIHAGVTCQRCHGPREAHIESEGEIREAFWDTASQSEIVNRCAECHRRAEEQLPSSIRPGNPDIVRFQPVGLVQSPCFKNSGMTCLTCHDPHRPMAAYDSLGDWQCLQCHDAAHPQQTTCSAGHTNDCLECHMPKVQMDSPLRFTDHWIRVLLERESTHAD